MHTQVCVVGTVATDPKLTKSAGKVAFCSFRLASNERRYDAEKEVWVDSETNWFTVNSFRGLAEHVVGSFTKGDRVIVNGRLRVRDWTNDERSGTSAVVEADALGHDLRWGTSVFTKHNATHKAEDSESIHERGNGSGSITDAMPRWNDTERAVEGAFATAGAIPAEATQVESPPGEKFEADNFTPKPEFSAS